MFVEWDFKRLTCLMVEKGAGLNKKEDLKDRIMLWWLVGPQVHFLDPLKELRKEDGIEEIS